MRRWTLCLVAMIGSALLMQSQVFAASGGFQSGASGGGTRGGGTRGAASGTRGAGRGGFPRGGFVRPGFPGAGLPGRGVGRFGGGEGRFGGGIGRFGGGDCRFGSGIGRFGGGEGRFAGREGRFGRFGEGRFGTGLYAGVTGVVPLPGLLGLPYYDGLEYPYFYPDTAAPYIDDLYGFPPDYFPGAAGYSLPPQTDYLPPEGAGAAGPQVWYYCQDPMGYYPYVRDCNTNWQAVPSSVLPPPPPQ